jgi:hypothetical protein
VGKYISLTAGMASMIGSMVHIILEMHLLKKACMKAGTFWGGIRRRCGVGLLEEVAEEKQVGWCSKLSKLPGFVLAAAILLALIWFIALHVAPLIAKSRTPEFLRLPYQWLPLDYLDEYGFL